MPHPHGVLAARHISKSYADVAVLEDLSLTIGPRTRVGLVGPNGIGKSTLLRLLAGVEQPDTGSVRREPPGLAVAYLPQTPPPGRSSPGQAARAALDAIAAEQADVLVLDEPTNNLDDAGLADLEALVARHEGGLVVASHDRAFLELMTSIVEFEPETRRVGVHAGGWSEFERERRRVRERHEAAYGAYASEVERLDEHAARLARWQQRGYGQGRKKKKTRDAGKAIEQRRRRIGEVEKPWSAWRLQMTLAPERRSGEQVAGLERAVIERHGFTLGPIDLELRRGDRVAVTGPNGAGKSTLLAGLLGEAPLSSGRRWIGPSTAISTMLQLGGPFAREQPLIAAFAEQSGCPAQEARSLLAKFGLGADHVRRLCATLSPGERTRGALALIVARGANTLVLDEPTNNLDLEAIEQLESALAGFDGTIVMVSHDRRFLEAFEARRTVRIGDLEGARAG